MVKLKIGLPPTTLLVKPPNIDFKIEGTPGKQNTLSTLNPGAPLVGFNINLAFSGILTAAQRLIEKGHSLGAVCWSLQEHAFAACIEVAERALAHSGKKEVLLGGGVACNNRLREMSTQMASERESTSHAPPRMYCIDNGTMIGLLGHIELKTGRKTPFESSGIDQYMRTDDTVVNWS